MTALRGARLARRAGARVKHAVLRPKPAAQPTAQPAQQPPEDPFLRLATDPSLWDEPFATYEEMRQQGPAYGLLGTHVIATGYEQVSTVLRDDRFAAESHNDDPTLAGMSHDCILKQNPPRHDEVRRVMSRGFTPRSIDRLRELIVDRCNRLLDEAQAQQSFDVVQDYALPLAIGVIADILGIPEEHRPRFRELGNSVARALDPYLPSEEMESLRASSIAMLEYFDRMFDERRRQPMEDLMSVLAAAEQDEVAVSPAEQRANAQFILLAGYETTVGMIGSGVNILVDRPDVWSGMRDNPELVRNVVEEVLRLESPVQMTNRRATEDLDLLGFAVPAGTQVMAMLGAANRDPAVFADPHTFVPDRDNAARNLAFVIGSHHCLGSALARLEGQLAFSMLLERMPVIRRGGPAVRRPNLIARGMLHVPIAAGA